MGKTKLGFTLSGKKTYVVCVLTIIWAVIGLAAGFLGAEEGVTIILAALGGAGVRAGIAKV